jgi:trans-aconitate methyltransferase
MKKVKATWCYIDGKKHCNVERWAKANYVSVDNARAMLSLARFAGMTVTFKAE